MKLSNHKVSVVRFDLNFLSAVQVTRSDFCVRAYVRTTSPCCCQFYVSARENSAFGCGFRGAKIEVHLCLNFTVLPLLLFGGATGAGVFSSLRCALRREGKVQLCWLNIDDTIVSELRCYAGVGTRSKLFRHLTLFSSARSGSMRVRVCGKDNFLMLGVEVTG